MFHTKTQPRHRLYLILNILRRKEGRTLLEKEQNCCLLREEQIILCSHLKYSFPLVSNSYWQEWCPVGNSITDHLQPVWTHCKHSLTNQQHLAAPSKTLSRWKAQWRSLFRLIAQELYVVLLSRCNFLPQCVLKVKMLSFPLGDICHWIIKV